MSSLAPSRTIGAPVDRVEGREKVTGQAQYAYEYAAPAVAYGRIVQSTIAKGRVLHVDASQALELPGVHTVLWHDNAPRLHEVSDGELAILQGPEVAYRGQIIAGVIADSLETARQAERRLRIEYAPEDHDVVLRADHPNLYTPQQVNPSFPSETSEGDVERAL